MVAIDTRPAVVDVSHYGGDTLHLQITVNADLTGATWTGEVRTARGAAVDATFSFVPNASGAAATISAVSTDALADLGAPVTEGGIAYKRYTGVYDIQIVLSGETTTLVRGTIIVDSDVTTVV